MRTLAALLFIAAVAVGAAFLARRKTVADGRVMEADLLDQFRAHGVTGMACDREIPIGLHGAVFTCLATLESGATQTVEYHMDRSGELTWKVVGSTGATRKQISPSGDPWAN
jgi:hypothetical protein